MRYIQANPVMVSQERCRDSSVSRWKRKTLSAWIKTKDLPLDNSINYPLSDFKMYLAVAPGFLFSKVVSLRILAEGNLSYIQANPDMVSQKGAETAQSAGGNEKD